MGTPTTAQMGAWHDTRAVASMPDASAEVGQAWIGLMRLTAGELPSMGLAAGERPAADVEVLAGCVAGLEFELARRMHAAASSGSLPLPGPGAMLSARAWSVPWARRLARAGQFASDHPALAGPWAAGIISSEHVDAVARNCDSLSTDELQAVLEELRPFWGVWSPAAVARFVRAAARMLHPPPSDDVTRDESEAHDSRGLSFSVLGDTVLLSGELPRLEGEVVMAAIDAFAERLRTEADHVPAAARRADALVELVNAAHARDALPARGGLPVSLNVTVETSGCGDPLWSTSRGHDLTPSEQRFASCDAALTPIVVEDARCPDSPAELVSRWWSAPDPSADPDSTHPASAERHVVARPLPAQRVAALAALLAGPRLPLAVGRTARTATPAQRRALAARDRGCIIPGCRIPAESCQAHHITEWARGGATDIDNLVLICWAHHRQVDLRMWTIRPGRPPAVDQATPGHARRDWPGNNGSPWTVTPNPRRRWSRPT